MNHFSAMDFKEKEKSEGKKEVWFILELYFNLIPLLPQCLMNYHLLCSVYFLWKIISQIETSKLATLITVHAHRKCFTYLLLILSSSDIGVPSPILELDNIHITCIFLLLDLSSF